MKKVCFSVLACAAGLGLMAMAPAQATEYQITVTGVTSGAALDPNQVFGAGMSIASGDSYVATYLVNIPSTPPESAPSELTYRGVFVSTTLAIDGNAPVAIDTSGTNYIDRNDFFTPTYTLFGAGGSGSPFISNVFTGFTTTPNPLSVPLSASSLVLPGSWQVTCPVGSACDSNGNFLVDGVGTGLTPETLTIVTAVPLPSSVWMAMAGVGLLGLAMRRRLPVGLTSPI